MIGLIFALAAQVTLVSDIDKRIYFKSIGTQFSPGISIDVIAVPEVFALRADGTLSLTGGVTPRQAAQITAAVYPVNEIHRNAKTVCVYRFVVNNTNEGGQDWDVCTKLDGSVVYSGKLLSDDARKFVEELAVIGADHLRAMGTENAP